jgi:hypothetical protein
MTSSKRGEDLFRDWHKKDPDTVFKQKVPALNGDFVCIGNGVEIRYSSDKWEKDGDFYPYVHDHTSRPKLYVPQKEASESDGIGRPRSGASLVGTRTPKTPFVVALLAVVDSFVFRTKDDDEAKLLLGKNAVLLGTPDRKALIILDGKRVAVVRGGSMKVTSRGIVD